MRVLHGARRRDQCGPPRARRTTAPRLAPDLCAPRQTRNPEDRTTRGGRNFSSKTCPSLGETRARPGAPRSLRGRSRRICLKGTPGTGTWNRRQAPGEPIGQAAYGLCPRRGGEGEAWAPPSLAPVEARALPSSDRCRGSDHQVAQTNPPVRGRVSADCSEEAGTRKMVNYAWPG